MQHGERSHSRYLLRWLTVVSHTDGLERFASLDGRETALCIEVFGFAIGESTMYVIGLMISGLPLLAMTILLAVLYYRLVVVSPGR